MRVPRGILGTFAPKYTRAVHVGHFLLEKTKNG
jgi:hypothetical protein